MNELSEQICDLLANYGIDAFVFSTVEAAQELEKAHLVEHYQESCKNFAIDLANLPVYEH